MHQLRPSLPLRFLSRSISSSSSSSSSNLINICVDNSNNINNYKSNPSPLLFQPPTRRPFKSQTRLASLSPTNQDEVDAFQLIQAHQQKAARLPPIEEIKTILHYNSRGVLSTFSLKYKGYPSGSMVDYACDAYGSPLLAVSRLAVHTKDLLANPKCSLLVAKDPEDRSDLVIVVHGDAIPVGEADKEAVRTAYLARHPNAFWVDFGDFQFLRIEPEVVRYVSGIATALLGSGEFNKEEFRTAKVDPIYQFSKPITSHMNKDHSDDIVQHSTSVPFTGARCFAKYKGYPSGSIVDYACDAYGSPLLAVSSLAVHTKDLLANPKCSLLVAKDPEDRSDLVIVVHGDAIPVSEADKEAVRTEYLARHPNAFWVDFGDFQFLRIEPEVVRYVSGVATALLGSGEFTKEEFRTAKVDPIYQFSKPITSHMNKDHSDDTKLIVQHSTSVPVDYAYMLDIDSLGFNVKAGYHGNTFKLRIPFTRRAEDRKDVKTLIVEMLQAQARPKSP